jgi:F420-non-reducing hydrogenase iron-sulfur subunit
MMFMPKIIGFVCNWSLPVGVDIASSGPIHGYPKIRIVRVTCIGRIDPAVVLETFAKGADGVLVIGCHPPDCHYMEGNLQAERKIKMLKKLISRTGLEPERLRLDWAYASETGRFAKIINDFRNQVMALGQSPLAGERPNTDILINIKAAKAASEDFRLRLLLGKEIELTEKKNMYGEKTSQEEFDKAMDLAIETEYLRNKIYLLIKNAPLSVRELSEHLDVDSREVLHHVVVLKQEGLVAVSGVKGTTPLYIALGEAS